MSFHAVHIADGQDPRYMVFESVQALQDWFLGLKEKSGYLYVFRGDRLLLTPGPSPFLVVDNEPIPLFRVPEPGAPNDCASLEELSELDESYEQLTPNFFDDDPDGSADSLDN